MRRRTLGDNTGKLTYCLQHGRELNMQVPRQRLCQTDGCASHAEYGPRGQRTRTHCTRHRADDMVTTHPHCIICGGHAAFGMPGKLPRFCSAHRCEGSIAFPRRRCAEPGCSALGTHGARARGPRFCDAHAGPCDINLVECACRSCGLTSVVNIDGLCEYCVVDGDSKKFGFALHAPRTRRSEMELAHLLTQNEYHFRQNLVATESACPGADRPDFMIRFVGCIVFVENDEHQHRGYPCRVTCICPVGAPRLCQCSQARMMDVAQAMGGEPVVWIRYNPDTYRNRAGHLVQTSRNSRHRRLLGMLEQLKARGVEDAPGLCTVFYLYYSGIDEEERVLIPFEPSEPATIEAIS